MITSSTEAKREPFHTGKWSSVVDAWKQSLNEEFWRHGITINQGLDWSVTEETARKRLNYIRARLLRRMFGNGWRAKAKITFVVFGQGSKESCNQHFHALMGIEGEHDWSDEQVAAAIVEIEWNRKRKHWEKPAYVDYAWRKANRFHEYVGREMRLLADVRNVARNVKNAAYTVKNDADSYFVM